MLSTGKTVGVMIGDVSYDYTMELMRGINDAAMKRGVQLFYMTGKQRHIAPDDPNNEQETFSRYNSIYDYANLVGADAYIISSGSLSGMESDEEYQQFMNRFEGSPYVLLQRALADDTPGRSSITADNYAIFSKCIEHLIEEHHYRNIAYISGPKLHSEAQERERAYRDTMRNHHLPVEESLVVYGDLSGFVDEQVARLMDAHPDLEAIAFCNDEMAKSGYKVCEGRGLRVGIDIAITGFDDFTTGRTMTPPLTTVSQDAYLTGELALIQALKLAAGEPVESIKLKTRLQIRNSCGCYHEKYAADRELDGLDAKRYIDAVLQKMQEELSRIFMQPDQYHLSAVAEKLVNHIRRMAAWDSSKPPDGRALDAWLIGFAAELGPSCGLVAERLHGFLLQMTDNDVRPELKRFYRIVLQIEGFLFMYSAREIAKRVERFRTQAWFVPEFIRDLVVIVDEDERVLLNVVNKLRGIGLKNLYIFILPEPQIRRETQKPYEAERLLLAACLSNGNAIAYPRARMPVIDKDHPLRSLKDLQNTEQMISFSIFSGDMQFGICLCETDRDNNPLMHIIGLQLGILMNFLDLKRKERVVAKEIEHVQKKNEELNYLSEYDTLCNVYNRRGFIEQALRLNLANIGKRASLAFADLDNLKKINDLFGHAAGDDALQTASDIFKKVIRSGDLIARIGGDEFVGMFIADSSNFRQNFELRIKQTVDAYNQSSGKPYIVEMSVGITDFSCAHDLEIGRIIDKADQYLYQAKKLKRGSIVK